MMKIKKGYNEKIVMLFVVGLFFLNSSAYAISVFEKTYIGNHSHLRPNVGISAERMQEIMGQPIELLVLDDEEMQRHVLTQALSASNVKKINSASSIEEGLELLRNNPGFNFLVVDFRLGNYKEDAEDNGVKFCHRAIDELGFKGRIVILSADDNTVIRELAKPQYQDLNERYQNGEILLRNKSDFGAIKSIKQIVEGKSGAVQKPAKEASDDEILNLITVNISPQDIGIEQGVVESFSDYHVIIADDKPFIRNAFEKTFKQFFPNTHKASNVDEVIRIINELREKDGKGVPDSKIIVLSDYEFGTEQTGKRARDGHDLLMALRLHPDADYKGEKLDFKGGFIFVSGSIVSKHEIQGYDPMHKDISQEIKDMYGIDYIEKSTDLEFQKKLVKMVYSRLRAPYNLAKPITKPLGRRPLSQPADIIFLNGGINDFEGRLSMAINNLIKTLGGISVDPETKENLGVLLESMLRFVDFGTVDRNMIFNARVHNYKGKLGLVGSYFIPTIQEYIQRLNADNRSKFDKFAEELDNLSLTLGIASNYTKRLLDLSSVVGNIGRPISFEDLKKISLEAFSQEYSNRINLKINTDEGQFKETEFPYALTFIMSYILENAVEQYALKFGKEFKGNIFVTIGKDTVSGEPVIDINIQDEAGGIAEYLLPDGLFRRQVTDKKEYGGTGYGLFWAKELIEIFGGSISAGNKDKGAFFNVRLPVDWKSRFDINAGVKKLEAKIVEILTKRQVKDAENVAVKIAQEIDSYSAQLSDITKRREAHLTNCFFTMRGSDREIEKMMPGFLSALDKSVNRMLVDYINIRIIAEQGVTKEEIENLFLSLLDITELKKDKQPLFSLLSERQIVRIQDENRPALLLRSKENVVKEDEPITQKEREEYQKAVRLIGYAIHKMSGNRSTISAWVDIFLKTLPDEVKKPLMDKFREELPQDMYRTIHYFTADFLTGFENDKLFIERVEGWKNAIREMVNAVDNLDRNIKEAAKRANVVPDENWQSFINKIIEEGRDLMAMLDNKSVSDKRWINASPTEDAGSRVKNFYGKYFHMSVAPSTRLWLKEFFLENTMLNICRAAGDKKDINVNVNEESGFTVFRITYKGQVYTDTMFMPKKDEKAAWHQGPLVLDLVEAMDGQISAKNIGDDVEITVKFPLPIESKITPQEREDYQRSIRLLGYSIHKLIGDTALVTRFVDEYKKELPEETRERIKGKFMESYELIRKDIETIHELTDSENQLTGFEDDKALIERVNNFKVVIRSLVDAISEVDRAVKDELERINPQAIQRETTIIKVMKEFVENSHDLLSLLYNFPISGKRMIEGYLALYPDKYSNLKGVNPFHLNVVSGTRLWLKEFFLENIMLNVFRLAVTGENWDKGLYVTVNEEQGSTVFNAKYKGDVDIDTAFKVKVDNKESWYNGPLLLWLIKAMDGKIEITKDNKNVNIRISFPMPVESIESPATKTADLNGVRASI